MKDIMGKDEASRDAAMASLGSWPPIDGERSGMRKNTGGDLKRADTLRVRLQEARRVFADFGRLVEVVIRAVQRKI